MVDVQSAGALLGRLWWPAADVAKPIVTQEMGFDQVGILTASTRGDPELL
jgi:hypothetical protein